jgi:hypothetical protein
MFCFEGDGFHYPDRACLPVFQVNESDSQPLYGDPWPHFATFVHTDESLRELLQLVRPLATG